MSTDSAHPDPTAPAPAAAVEPRPLEQRKADTLAKLAAPVADAWVASAGADGPYLVPLSLAWHADRIVLAVQSTARTGRNIAASGTARLALGGTRDVVMIDTELDEIVPVTDAGATGDAYAAQSDWDPREEPGGYVFLILRPTRIQAWREVNELAGRLLMRAGKWL